MKMSKEEDKKNVYNQMAWILNYQPTIKEQHIHMGDKSSVEDTGVEPQKQAEDDSPVEKHNSPQGELNFFCPEEAPTGVAERNVVCRVAYK